MIPCLALSSRTLALRIVLLAATITPQIGEAQTPSVQGVTPATMHPGRPVWVTVSGLKSAMDKGLNLDSVRLYLDGFPLSDVRPEMVSANRDTIAFRLERNDSTRATWQKLYRRYGARTTQIAVNIGGRGSQFPLDPKSRGNPTRARIELGTGVRIFLAALCCVALLGLLLRLDRRYGLLRELPRPDIDVGAGTIKPVPSTRTEYPYSLGQVQMAFWFVLVTTAFVTIALITSNVNGIVTTQSLILVGIGAGAALGSAAIRDAKRSGAARAIRSLAIDRAATQVAMVPFVKEAIDRRTEEEVLKLGKPVTRAGWREFFIDILLNDDGLAFHRFQVVTYSLLLGAIFVYTVVTQLAFPEFDSLLLALMGISGGTYLGFKVPEVNAKS